MKKFLTALVAIAALTSASHANIYVEWKASAGFYANGTAGNYPADGVGNVYGNDTYAQLIWSSDSVADLPSLTGDFTSGNDILLSTFTGPWPVDGFAYFVAPVAEYDNGVFGQTLENGWVYARIFQDSAPGIGDFYYNSALIDANPYTGTESPQTVELNTDGAISNLTGDEFDLQIVPEPSVLAFLGLGGLLMAIRRTRA